MSQSENRSAGLLAVAAAAMGLIVVVVIVLSGARGGPGDSEPTRGIGERVPAGGARGAPADGPRALARPDDGAAPVAVTRGPDGGLDEGLAEASADLEAVRERRDPTDFRPSAEKIAADRAEAERVAATLTPEQRYEAQAFFHDLLVLRADALRTQIAAAREAGDGRTLRRLEPALAIVTEELGRSSDRMRTMEAELGRDAHADEAPATEEGEGEAGEGEAGEGEAEEGEAEEGER